MNIVYGVAGEGLGHVFEAIVIAERLKSEGHRVKVLTFGDRAMASLEALSPTRVEGVHLYFDGGRLSVPRTFRNSLPCIPFYFRNWTRLRRELEVFSPDVFLTAYEPFTTIAAHVLGKPLISMDNQNELLHLSGSAEPEPTLALTLAKWVTLFCTHGADRYIVKSFGKPRRTREDVHFVYPVIQNEIRALKPFEGAHVLVYLTKPNPKLIEILKAVDASFVVYCNNRVGQEANISYRAQGPGFVRDLAGARAIVATTGFSLIADSIFLKKPYFGVPLKGQFEQTHNARFLARSGLGDFREDPTKADIEGFLSNLDVYRRRLEDHPVDPAEQEETLLALLAEVRTRGPVIY